MKDGWREIEVRLDGTAAIVVLNRPDRGNALSAALVEELIAALESLASAEIDVVIFEGAGKGFCGGFDLTALARETDGSLLHRFIRMEELLGRLARFPKLTVCYAQRFAYGAGADLLCACDLRFAAPDCRLAFPGPRFGLVLGTGRLSARIGSEAATEWLLGAKVVRAEDAGALVSETLDAEAWPVRRAELAAGLPVPRADLPLLLSRLRPRTCDDAEMAALARSAARPGLKQRIAAYVASLRANEPN